MRRAFTLVELLVAGAILATISTGAIVGMMRISDFVDKRAELMAADGFCWDLIWKMYVEGEEMQDWVSGRVAEHPRPEGGNHYLEIKGRVVPSQEWGKTSSDIEFLSAFHDPVNPPVCYITVSNRWDGTAYDESGFYVSVNLEWGPASQRRILVRRADTPADAIVFDHPVELFCSKYATRQLELQ